MSQGSNREFWGEFWGELLCSWRSSREFVLEFSGSIIRNSSEEFWGVTFDNSPKLSKGRNIFSSVFWRCFRDRAQWFPRQRNWSRTCKCAVTLPPTFANLITIGSIVKHQILAQSVNRFLRYGDGVCTVHVRTCRGTQPMTCIERIATRSLTTSTTFQHNASSDFRNMEKRCARADVGTPSMTYVNCISNRSLTSHQISA